MNKIITKVINNKWLYSLIKVSLCLLIITIIGKLLLGNYLDARYEYRDYRIKNTNNGGEWNALTNYSHTEQDFIASGNYLNNISIYYGESDDKDIEFALTKEDGSVLDEYRINTGSLKKNAWNDIGISSDKLKRNNSYRLKIFSENGLDGIYYGNGDAPEEFSNLIVDDSDIEGGLRVQINQTYTYMNLSRLSEFITMTLFAISIGIALCISITKFEVICKQFMDDYSKKKHKGFLWALYFAVSLVLLYNPVDNIRTKVIDFKRVIGYGLIFDVDVARRISNFSYWIIAFSISFVLIYMLANYCINRNHTEEQIKIIAFLDGYMSLANCTLLLRCITFFQDANDTSAFYISQNIIMLIAILAISYLVFKLDRYLSSDTYEQLVIVVLCLSIALAVSWGSELEKGRLLIGAVILLLAVTIVLCFLGRNRLKEETFKSGLMAGTLLVAFLPLFTSLYIEMIHVLNQYNIFVSHPAKYYEIACVIGLFISAFAVYIVGRRKCEITSWKRISFPVIVVGISCLSVQIPLYSVYNPHLYEGANASILISDFLNFGDIPIVQHYGGHMMEYVWEGILYAVVNNDYAGIVSPYKGLLKVVLILLLYYVIGRIWNKEMALLSSLLFPFYDFISYYGLGLLLCLAAMLYVKKNTMVRAIFLWGAFVWCALYRLDLGFAFGFAVIIAMVIYAIVDRNSKAIRELGISLVGWGIFCGSIWFVICVIKGINPINRLIEFLMLNLSNQNWAYAEIGDAGNTLFAWGYIIIPFVMAISLIYVVCSKRFRDEIGIETWILLLILNLSYFQNFSRGLVRHSLAELSSIVLIWTAYLFLSLFISLYIIKDKAKFLIVFTLSILLNTLFLQDANIRGIPVVDSAVLSAEPIIESWKPTRFYKENDQIIADDGTVFETEWEKIRYTRDKVDRVILAEPITDYADDCKLVLNALLNENETYVDFINKTLLYSVLGYRCPVYISQSPLQLSGEFTQNEFIKEISGVPVILMPVNDLNNYNSIYLDDISNAYRYYKVYEYICSSYKPLCQYGDEYAIWCLNDKYDEYYSKISIITQKTEYVQKLASSEVVVRNNVDFEVDENGYVNISSIGNDPGIEKLQKLFDLSHYADNKIRISLECESDVAGDIQVYYTTEKGEPFTDKKVISAMIVDNEEIIFDIPVTANTKLRMDFPEGSIVKVKSLAVGYPVKYIDYGYDGPIEHTNSSGNTSYEYLSSLHQSNICDLPRIWAETDNKNAINNPVLSELNLIGGYYYFDKNIDVGDNGNYLKISATYDGKDSDGKYKSDDESVKGTIILGVYSDDKFEEKYRYDMDFDEGTHDYLIRCSADYYWYQNQVNAVRIDTQGELREVSMSVLQGD